jgi:hypothetical protein
LNISSAYSFITSNSNNNRFLRGQNPFYNQVQGQQISSSSYLENDILLQKLNYMINLLEEKQDEKTNNVTEEIILYSFLGIFIIFIVDSFARVGKYVR